MIRSFRHDGLERFFRSGSKAGIQPAHAGKLQILLTALDAATEAESMDLPGWGFHALTKKGTSDLRGHFGIKVSGNWRLIFRFEAQDAVLVDYQDYH